MVETAARLFQEHGYRATSWRRLVDEAGTPWGSAHHHFPGGKEQLGVAAIELGDEATASLIETSFAAESTPAAAVRRWFATSARAFERSGHRAGCPVATVALETAPELESLTAACRRAFERWHGIVERGLAAGGVEPERAPALATLVLSSFEGALLASRVAEDTRPLRDAAELLAERLPGAGAP